MLEISRLCITKYFNAPLFVPHLYLDSLKAHKTSFLYFRVCRIMGEPQSYSQLELSAIIFWQAKTLFLLLRTLYFVLPGR